LPNEFENRLVLITGGASGIGAATARQFATAGAGVVITDIDTDAGEALARELGSSRAHFLPLDVRAPEQVDEVVAAGVDRLGGLHILFNNAGIGLNAPLEEHSMEQIENLIAINLRAAILMSRAALPHLRSNADGGVIINNASNGGVIGRAPDPVYVATKHGLVGFTKSLALAHVHDTASSQPAPIPGWPAPTRSPPPSCSLAPMPRASSTGSRYRSTAPRQRG
jgi:NAD(P)-dependent dehydrogenase (short-subunit alcohol dehydrogenase family)